MVNWKHMAARLDAVFGIESHSDRITSVEGARGIAMSLVFLIHLLEFFCAKAPAGSIDSGAIYLIYPLGNLAGVFFVVITGCFLYRSLLKGPVNYFAYLRRRLTRIYAVFLVVLAAYVALSAIFPSKSKLPHDPAAAVIFVIENLLLLPGVLAIEPIIVVSWTLSYVVLFCLILPPLVEFTGMREWRPSRRAEFFFVTAVLCAAVANATGWYPLRLALLPVGSLAWEALAWRAANRQTARWLEPAAAATSVLALSLKYWFVQLDGVSIFACSQGIRQLTISAICLFCACFTLFSANSVFSNALTSRPLRWLGNMSFSYYLTHGLSINFLTLFTPAVALVISSPLGFWSAVVGAYAFSIVPAVLLFLLVEKRSLAVATRADRETVQAAFAEAA